MPGLPLYELLINPKSDNLVVDAIALVENPAIEEEFIAFGKESEFRFNFEDERMELIGPAFIPGMKIFRKDAQGNMFNVFAKAETVRLIAQEYFRRGFQNNLNLDHTEVDAHSFVFQSYITDSKFGISAPNGMKVPDGTWIVGVKVNDRQVWNDIKAGKRKGFSIEGLFNMVEIDFSAHERNIYKDIIEALNDVNSTL